MEEKQDGGGHWGFAGRGGDSSKVGLVVAHRSGFIWERSNDSEIRVGVRTVRASVPNFVPTTKPDDLRWMCDPKRAKGQKPRNLSQNVAVHSKSCKLLIMRPGTVNSRMLYR